MESLKKLIQELKYINTNIDCSCDVHDYFTLLDLYNIAEPRLEELCSKYDITMFQHRK